MSERKEIVFEGYLVSELLALPHEQVEGFVLSGEPITFKVGSAEILGRFRISGDALIVELAHIDGGGEGVLSALWSLTERYAARRRLTQVEWIVHAVHCAQPNLKLRRILESKGFSVRDVEGVGEEYHYMHNLFDPVG